ncbi:MAG: metal ABC transporter substrate-binding protein, partial [Candidatus Limnocylindrales bacterium]
MRVLYQLALLLAVVASPAVVAEAPAEGRPSVVITTEVLGAVAKRLAGDLADVVVLMDGGSDPHAWQPSARDSEALFGADLVIANGLGLEEGLVGALEQAEADGVPVFRATDHLADRTGLGGLGPGDAGGDDAVSDAEAVAGHGLAAGDPHFWLDPLAMRDVVLALAPVMADAGVDVGDRAALLAADLEALPDERRRPVSGHGDLGDFAHRYGFSIV